MWLDLVMERYRLSKNKDSLHDLLNRQGYNMTHLARKVDRSTAGFIKMLKGDTSRYDEDVLRKLSKEIGLLYGRDEYGIFFYDPDEEGELIKDLDRELQRFIEYWKDATPAQRQKYIKLWEFINSGGN